MASAIGTKAQKQNPALAALAGMVGEWATTGTHPLVPGVTLHGRSEFAWQDGGAFLVCHSELDDPRFPNGIAIFGSDDAAKTWFVSYFDERGISRKYDVALTADGFSMARLTPEFSQRMTFRLEAGGDRIVSRGEMSRDGGPWEADLPVTYERVK